MFFFLAHAGKISTRSIGLFCLVRYWGGGGGGFAGKSGLVLWFMALKRLDQFNLAHPLLSGSLSSL